MTSSRKPIIGSVSPMEYTNQGQPREVKSRRRVRQRPDDAEEEPPVIPTEDELPMDPYNVALRCYQDNIGRGVNYTNMHLDLMIQNLNIQCQSESLVLCLYIPTWDEHWTEQHGGSDRSGGGNDDK
ncbi:unnamed protein product [Lactuca saligna]|uniref:Uncharacterized protein n=1 Tax=Lactuca saligna TaxID=75948 RepID=A0AA36DZA8_LACSI|nr:unnamed protein product [Lactuca saligna]